MIRRDNKVKYLLRILIFIHQDALCLVHEYIRSEVIVLRVLKGDSNIFSTLIQSTRTTHPSSSSNADGNMAAEATDFRLEQIRISRWVVYTS